MTTALLFIGIGLIALVGYWIITFLIIMMIGFCLGGPPSAADIRLAAMLPISVPYAILSILIGRETS